MQIEDIRAFARIAASGSISEASRLHGQPKASLSHQLRRLELELSADLFERRGGRLVLNEAGRNFLPHASDVARVCQQAEDAVALRREQAAIRLTIGTTDELGTNLMGPLAIAFRRENPAIHLTMTIAPAAALLHRDSGLDCVVFAGNPPEELAGSMRAKRFGRYVSRLYASPDYVAEAGLPLTPEDLARHALIRTAGRDNADSWHLSDGKRFAEITPSGTVATNDNWMSKLGAVQGQGIGFFPEFFVQDEIAAGALQPILHEWTSDAEPLMVLTHPHRFANPHIRAIVRFISERFKGFYSYPYRRDDHG